MHTSLPSAVLRGPVTAALLLAAHAARASAQGVVGGWAVAAGSDEPLPCLAVALVDARERVVAREMTARDGSFQLDAPPTGAYHLHFGTDAHLRVSPVDTLSPGSMRTVRYLLGAVPTPANGEPVIATTPPGAPDAWAPAPLLATGGPRYPQALKAQGRAGEVRMRNVVDSTGRVEPASLRILAGSDDAFSDAVLTFLRREDLRFTPAQRHGVPVCALVEAPFRFTMGRDADVTLRVFDPPQRRP